MSKKNIPFQTSFEPGYQQFSQKIAEITKNNKIAKSQINIQKLQHELDLINQQIQEQGLQFIDSSIFSRYATIQQLAAKKKEVPQMCPNCGDQIKKQVQCQICAQIYCKNCCWRKRIIPQSQHKDFRLSCQECHNKYIKLFSNQKFYKQKQIYLKVIEELAKKYEKAQTKLSTKKQEYKIYQQEKMSFKMKEGTIKKQIMDEQKKYNKVKQQFQQLIKQKAKKIKEQQQKKKQQEDKRKQEQQKKKQYQQQKKQQQQQRKQIQKNKAKQHLSTSEQKRKADEQSVMREKITKQLQIKAQKQKNLENLKKQEQIKRQRKKMDEQKAAMLLQKQKLQKEKIEIEKIKAQFQSPKKQSSEKTLEQNKIQNVISQIKQTKKQENNKTEADIKTDITEKTIDEHIKQSQTISFRSQNKTSQTTVQDNIFSNILKKQPQQEPVSPSKIIQQTLTMSNIKSMNINDLLGMKIPMNPNKVDRNSKIQQTPINALKSTRESRQNQNESREDSQILDSSRISRQSYKQQESQNSVKSFHDQQPAHQKRMTKDDLLRRSSLISSKKNTITSQPQQVEQTTGVDARNICSTCQIM